MSATKVRDTIRRLTMLLHKGDVGREHQSPAFQSPKRGRRHHTPSLTESASRHQEPRDGL